MKILLTAAVLIGLALGIALTGCLKDPQSTKIEGNGIKVEFLFEHDGVKMYRFYDGGQCHYFTNQGETITTQNASKSYYEERIK